jgi:MFS family permease
VQGIGSAGLVNLAVVIIGDHWTGNERAKLIGRNAATLTVSLAVFPLLGGVLTQAGGWRMSFAPYPLALLTAVAIWRMLPDVELHPQPHLRAQLGDAFRVLRQPLLAGATLAAFGVFFLIFGLYLAVLPVHLEDEFGIDALGRGLVLALPAASSTVMALSLGRLRARYGGRALVLTGSVLFAAAFLVIGVAPTLPILLAGSFAYGFGEGLTIPTYQDYVVGAAPVASRGAVLAVWVGAARAGQVCGPLAAGVGMSAAGTGETFVVGALIAAAMLVAQLWLPAGRVPRRTLALEPPPG